MPNNILPQLLASMLIPVKFNVLIKVVAICHGKIIIQARNTVEYGGIINLNALNVANHPLYFKLEYVNSQAICIKF